MTLDVCCDIVVSIVIVVLTSTHVDEENVNKLCNVIAFEQKYPNWCWHHQKLISNFTGK